MRRAAAMVAALVAVTVLGAACGKYPSPRVDPGPLARAADSRAAAQPAAAPTEGAATSQDSTIVGDDGADGPQGKVIIGGTSTVDLSKVFSGKGTRAAPGAKGGTPSPRTTPGTGSKSSTGSSKPGSKGGDRTGSQTKRGDDGANPGSPAVSGGPTTATPAGATNLAELISRETTRGATYNSTILPRGFPFTICPVQGHYSFSDDYGAPRYAGGYHPHAGNDIFAAMGTPIVAPFDGYVSRVPNTLGGNAVEVKGSQGYVYMAHLVAYGITDRAVRAGTVVGFVGNTGDAQATSPHDHFEWHPYTVASYDRVIAGTNGAVDPFPYLQVVCPPG